VTAYDTVTARLTERTGGTGRNGQWRCPAHHDHTPSLSISPGSDGKVLLYCHAGCSIDDIVAALGLELTDLFDTPAANGQRDEIVNTYDYVDEDGQLLFQVVRKTGKRFVQRRPDGADGWIWNLGDTRRVLYRLPQVLEAVETGIPVYVVEGEKDADRLAAVGYVATCNPHGAGKWRSTYNASLEGADVVIVADRDEAGRAHARDIAHQLEGIAANVRVLEPAVGKDVSDHLAAGRGIEDLVDLANSDSDTADDLLAGLRNGAWLDAQDFPPLRYHLPGIVPEGSSLLVGPPKIGKSWLVLSLALAAAAGGRALGQPIDARPVFYLALEDGHRRLQDRCRTLLDTDRIPPAFDYLCTVQPGMVVPTIEAWLARHPGADALVILDTLGKVMPPALMGESSYGRDYRVGTSLKRLVDEQPGSALLTNHHDRKAHSDDFVDRVSGTNGLAGAADTIIVVTRPRHANDGVIQVTGRDVAEGEYAVSFNGPRGLWTLDGNGLAGAAATVAQRRANEGLDDRSRSVIAYVNEHPEGVRWGDVKRDLGEDEARYLSRLYESGRIARPSRGLYVPLSVVSGVSGFTTETDTPDTPSESGHPETDTTDTTDSALEGTLHLFTREFGPLTDVDADDYARAQNRGELPVVDRNDGTWF
jgi:5S rRNA maturation endonuclease (ribonuclease M5)